MLNSPYGHDAPSGEPFPSSITADAVSQSSASAFSPSNYVQSAVFAPPQARLSIEERIRRRQEQEAAAAATDDNDNLDPNLMLGLDHSASSSSLSSSKRHSSDSDLEDSPEPTARRGDFRQLVASFKARKRYKPHIAAVLDEWSQCDEDPISRELVLLGAVLDVLNNTSQVEVYRIPPGLKSNLRKYTFGVILSPILTAYRGNIVSAVMNTIRELKIANVPDEKDEDQIETVAAEIGSLAIEARNIIKKQITESLKPNKQAESHISDLTHNILKATATELAMTIPMQIRVAFLRTVFQEGRTDYWLKVDQKLRQWEEVHYTSELLLKQMQSNLKIDQEDFPRPNGRLVLHPTTPTKDLSTWQLVCDRHAGQAGTEKLARKGKGRGKDS